MKIFKIILKALEHEMTTPTNYGWFHLMFIGIIIITTVLVCIFFRKKRRQGYQKDLLNLLANNGST